ncbi:hypothetical protein FOA52_008815 [Chlamydomonas sp. UWO 241]|nr:hypothetical protein FOA52_008815 [Chlamydomonas sp. UWO 241]
MQPGFVRKDANKAAKRKKSKANRAKAAKGAAGDDASMMDAVAEKGSDEIDYTMPSAKSKLKGKLELQRELKVKLQLKKTDRSKKNRLQVFQACGRVKGEGVRGKSKTASKSIEKLMTEAMAE